MVRGDGAGADNVLAIGGHSVEAGGQHEPDEEAAPADSVFGSLPQDDALSVVI
jgi:hypothetical protein